MKNRIFAVIAIMTIATLSYSLIQQPKNLAEVEQIQGLYIFTDSKPVTEYEYLGTIKTGAVVMSSKHKDVMSILLKKAKKEYPTGEAIILSSDYFEADVIKFK
jgi:hypothetical protein